MNRGLEIVGWVMRERGKGCGCDFSTAGAAPGSSTPHVSRKLLCSISSVKKIVGCFYDRVSSKMNDLVL